MSFFILIIRSVHQRAYRLAGYHLGQIARSIHAEHHYRQTVLLAQGRSRQIHHLQPAVVHLVIAYLAELGGRRVLLRIGRVHAVDSRSFQHHVGFHLYAAQSAARIGGEERIAGVLPL